MCGGCHTLSRMALPHTVRFANKSRAFWKLLLSFRKRDWVLSDYPVWTREQEPDPEFTALRFKQHRYVASIVGWTLSGSGDSATEAMDNLKVNFETAKAERAREAKRSPRPGTRAPIEFASQAHVDLYPDLAQDFVRRVLELEWAWISDESCLWHFHTEETNDRLNVKIIEVYGVDVSDIESGRLADILDRIAIVQTSTDQM